MFSHSTTKISTEHVNHIVKSILNKRQRNLHEQQQTFLRRNTDEKNKRNNYILDKFTIKKHSAKENIIPATTKLISPIEIHDDDDDFISIKKPPSKIPDPPKLHPMVIKTDPIKECLDSIISQIENNDATCPICNQMLSNLFTIDQRQQHVNRCLEESQLNNVHQTKKSRIYIFRYLFSFRLK
jgi:hypothetical protein